MTFVLTDVVGSTQLWQDAPEAMEEALTAHDKLVTDAVESQGGVVLKARGEGDSTFSVFARASDGLRAAYLAQVALTRHEWPEAATLRVRFAVHTGEAAEKDGDYLGTTVNRAARLRSVCESGEVLVSAATAQVVADHLPLDTSLRPLGAIRLRDLDRAEDACVLVGPGLLEPGTGARGETAVGILAGSGVSKRERDVLDALGERLTNLEIAERLSVSERTVESHVSSLLRKLGAANRVELAALAKEARAAETTELPPMLMMSAQRSKCVGRQEERERLLECWDRASSGQTVFALVTGEAGIGKTRLAAELATEVYRRGGRVVLGASSDGAQMPYQPFVEALEAVVAATPESQLRSDLRGHLPTLSRLFPGAARFGVPGSRDTDPLSERGEAQSALTALVIHTARRHPLMLVLEDMHWASAPTRDAALRLVRDGGTAPLLVVVTTRDTVPELDSALTSWLAAAARLPGCDFINLTGLDLDATADLLAGIGGRVDPAVALRDTGGNPLFLREVAAGGTGVSPTLRDFLANRYARLDAADLDVVDTAAVLGESFRADHLAAATQRSRDEVIDALERAADAGLVEAVARQPGRYAFVHALFRDNCYHALSAGRQLRLHARVTEALRPFASDPTVLPELARHACIAAPIGDAASAVDLARRAGDASLREGDMPQAALQFGRALDVIDLTPEADEHLRLALMVRLGEASMPEGIEASHAILRDALRLARRLGDAAAFADAVCSMPYGEGSVSPGLDDPTFIGLCEEALAGLGDTHGRWRARLLSVLAVHLALGSQPERGQALGREAVSVAREAGEPIGLAHALLSLQYALGSFDVAERRETMEEALSIARQHGADVLALRAAGRLADIARTCGDLDAYRRWQELARGGGRPQRYIGFQADVIDALLEGDLAVASTHNRLDRIPAVQVGGEHLYWGSAFIIIEMWKGRPHVEAIEPFASRAGFDGKIGMAMLAFSHVLAGGLVAASQLVADAHEKQFETQRWHQSAALGLAFWAEVAFGVDDASAAAELSAVLAPLAGQIADAGGAIWCSVDLARALLAATVGDLDQAEAIVTGAITASRARRNPLLLARELLVLAMIQSRLGREGVGDLVAEALEIGDPRRANLIRMDAARYGLVAEPAL